MIPSLFLANLKDSFKLVSSDRAFKVLNPNLKRDIEREYDLLYIQIEKYIINNYERRPKVFEEAHKFLKCISKDEDIKCCQHMHQDSKKCQVLVSRLQHLSNQIQNKSHRETIMKGIAMLLLVSAVAGAAYVLYTKREGRIIQQKAWLEEENDAWLEKRKAWEREHNISKPTGTYYGSER